MAVFTGRLQIRKMQSCFKYHNIYLTWKRTTCLPCICSGIAIFCLSFPTARFVPQQW